MDIAKTTNTKALAVWHKLILAAAVIVIIGVIYQQSNESGVSVPRSNIIVETV